MLDEYSTKEYALLVMFTGPYNFFDYKYNIAGYEGQDFDNPIRWIFLIVSLILIPVLCVIFRKTKEKQMNLYLGILGIFMIVLYLTKSTWESVYDIQRDGAFNTYILPFDTCSIIMLAAPLAGFARGYVQKAAKCWLATGGIVGGISNLLFLQALKYYPFWTFGAFYSMFWHFIMVFTGVFLIITKNVELNWKSVVYGFAFHMAFSLIVIPIDHILDMDFMLYRNAGGAPLVEDLASKLNEQGLYWLTTILMIHVYLLLFAFIIYLSLGISKLVGLFQKLFHMAAKPQE